MMVVTFSFILLALCPLIASVKDSHAENSFETINQLVKKLFTDYDSGLRPSSPHVSTNLSVAFQIQQLLDVNQVHKTIRVHAWTQALWFDQHLTWDPALYDDTEVFRYPHDKIWKPDLMLMNTPDLNDGLIINKASTYAMIYPNGTVLLTYTAIYEVTCPNLNAIMFPFDKFTCFLEFGSWTYNGQEVDLFWMTPKSSESMSLQQHSEWKISQTGAEKIVELDAYSLEPYPIVRVHLYMERMPLYYIYNLVIPVYMICIVAFIGMFSPSTANGERIEKVTLGITTLLSMSILMLTMSSAMPVTSNEIPIMFIYYGLFLIIITVATIATTLIIQIEMIGLDGRPLPNWAKKWFLETIGQWILCKYIKKSSKRIAIAPLMNPSFLNGQSKTIHSTDEFSINYKPHFSTNSVETKTLQHFYEVTTLNLHNITELLRNIDDRMKQDEEEKANRHDWRRFAKTLDLLLMIMFLFISTLLTIALLMMYR